MSLKDVREFLGLTQKELAERLTMSQVAISSIECGRRRMTERFVDNLCLVFGLNKDFVMSGEGEPYAVKLRESDAWLDDFVRAYGELDEDGKAFVREFAERCGLVVGRTTEKKLS